MKIRALLAGLLCAMSLVVVTGCGKKEAKEPAKGPAKAQEPAKAKPVKVESPETAIKELKEGFAKGDAAKVKARVAKNSELSSEMLEAIIKEPKIQEMWKKAEIVSSTENGDSATVKVKLDGKEEDIKLVKEDGKWKMKE